MNLLTALAHQSKVFDVLFKLVICRDEEARMWTKREAEWERERLARERLMAEVRKAFAYTVTVFTVTYTVLVTFNQ